MFQSSLLSAYSEKIKDEEGNTLFYAYENVWTEYAKNSLANVFLYVAIALAVILVAVGIFVRFRREESLRRYAATAVAIAVGFCVSVIVAMLSLEFFEMNEKGYIFDLVLYPSVVLAAVVVLGVAATYVASLFGKKAFRITAIVCASLAGAALASLLVCSGVYFSSGDAESNNWVEVTVSENVALYLSAAVIIIFIVLCAVFFGKGEKKGFDSKTISYAAICIALSFALSYLKLWAMPQGGSVTFASLLPLMVFAYMFGVRKGVFAGFIYGVLQAVQDPWVIHPAQFLLDYPVAFACIGLAGLFARFKKLEKLPQIQFALGAVVASVLRFVCHVLSGVFAFSEYSTLDNVWAYSMGYNSFVFVDIAIAIVVGVIVFSSPSFVKQARKFNATKAQADEPAAEETPENTEHDA